jgi:hypothetical protein
LLGIAAILVSSAHCSFERVEGVPTDGEVIPDAGPCEELSISCATSTVLRECRVRGDLPVDTTCPWGCFSDGAAHCGKLQPTGSALIAADLDPNGALQDRTASSGGTIDTETGAITGLRMPGEGILDGIDFEVRTPTAGGPDVGVFRFGKLALQGTWIVGGPNALAIVSLGDVSIQGVLDLRGDCSGNNAGPGGSAGADRDETASGDGGGTGGTEDGGGMGPPDYSGGGGGGYGADGGNGGDQGQGQGPGGGADWGDPTLAILGGGGGGGGGGGQGGGDPTGGVGGGGGGAVQIIANGKVLLRVDPIAQPSGVNAGGCGGKGGSNGGAGGGGGAGGAILIEAPALELDGAHLAVNGGGGGGGNNSTATGTGASGALATTRATAGQGGAGSGNGGQGGAAGDQDSREGATGQDDDQSGGGGGGVGRIRVNTRGGMAVTIKNNAIVSPTFADPGTTSTQGSARVQ